MKQILLVCNAGMSTSMLVQKMQKAAESKGVAVNIKAKSLTDAKKSLSNEDVILVGPQIRYELNNIKQLAVSIPVDAIDMKDYGLINGESVLNQALKLLGE